MQNLFEFTQNLDGLFEMINQWQDEPVVQEALKKGEELMKKIPNLTDLFITKITHQPHFGFIGFPEVIIQSPNEEYFVLSTASLLFLVNKYGQHLLKIKIAAFRACFHFSQDSKFFAILFSQNFWSTQYKLLLYDLEIKKVRWVLKLNYKYDKKQFQGFQFFESSILISLMNGFSIITLDGQIIKTPLKYQDCVFQIVADKFLLVKEVNAIYVSYINYIVVFPLNFKSVKQIGNKNQFYDASLEEIINLSKLIIIQQPNFCLRELVNGKMLRRKKKIETLRSGVNQGFLIKHQFYFFDPSILYTINLYTGTVILKSFQVPYFTLDCCRYPIHIKAPYFLQVLKNKRNKKNYKTKEGWNIKKIDI